MNREVKQRLTWVKLYERTGNAGLTCRRCGISRPTLRKWWRRYQAEGIKGLESRSRRPKHIPYRKVTPEVEGWILDLRQKRMIGSRRIQNELKRLHDFHLSLETIHKVLKRNQVAPLRRSPRRRHTKRYEMKVPGERVQMDTMKVAPGLFQYTAIDDCSRFQVMKLYPRRTAAYTLEFLEHVQDEMPFPIQRIQTDRGMEFTAYGFRLTLEARHVKWRPNKPRKPHLNGKVERVQQTDLQEFYATADLSQSIHTINEQLAAYQDYYNHERVHGSTGCSPRRRYLERLKLIPYSGEVWAQFDLAAEERRHRFFGMEWMLEERNLRRKPQ
jgi:transposase InsO family protein